MYLPLYIKKQNINIDLHYIIYIYSITNYV